MFSKGPRRDLLHLLSLLGIESATTQLWMLRIMRGAGYTVDGTVDGTGNIGKR